MPEREHKPNRNRTLSLLHQFARDVVDRRNVVGIHRVAKSKAVSKKGSAKKHWIMVKCDQGPEPRSQIESQQHGINRDDFVFRTTRLVVEQGPQEGAHWVPFGTQAQPAKSLVWQTRWPGVPRQANSLTS